MPIAFYVLLTASFLLTVASGCGALFIVMQGGSEITASQQRLLDVLIKILVGGASAFFLLLTAHLSFGLKGDS